MRIKAFGKIHHIGGADPNKPVRPIGNPGKGEMYCECGGYTNPRVRMTRGDAFKCYCHVEKVK